MTSIPDRYYNLDAEDNGERLLLFLGETRHKEPLRINRRAAEADLLIYVNFNFVPMNGGHKSVGVRLCDYEVVANTSQPERNPRVKQLHRPGRASELRTSYQSGSANRRRTSERLFHIETTVNNYISAPIWVSSRRTRTHFTAFDRMKYEGDAFRNGAIAAASQALNVPIRSRAILRE